MLVLTRKVGEAIVTSNGVRVTIVKVVHGRVSIGIEAADDVTILREEVEARPAKLKPLERRRP